MGNADLNQDNFRAHCPGLVSEHDAFDPPGAGFVGDGDEGLVTMVHASVLVDCLRGQVAGGCVLDYGCGGEEVAGEW